MKIKILEIRDIATRISALCIDMNEPANEAQRVHLRMAGYPLDARPNIAITHLDAGGQKFLNDPWAWDGRTRTWPTAHHWIIAHWHELEDGDVVCVEHILGERTEPKEPELYRKGK